MICATGDFVVRLVECFRRKAALRRSDEAKACAAIYDGIADRFETGHYTPALATSLLTLYDDQRIREPFERACAETFSELEDSQLDLTPNEFMRAVLSHFHRDGELEAAAAA